MITHSVIIMMPPEIHMMKMVQVMTTVCLVCMSILLSILAGLYNKLVHLTNDSLINVTNDVIISSIIELVGLSNITILGHNNPTVYCNNYGGLHLMSCYNCTIEGITWNGCGGRNDSDSQNIQPVLQLSNSTNIIIKYCSIQKSVGQALVLSGVLVSGDVIIEYCRFLHNKQYRSHGTAIHFSSSISYNNLTIANCNFYANSAMHKVWYILVLLSLAIYILLIFISKTLVFITIQQYPYTFLTKNLTFMER